MTMYNAFNTAYLAQYKALMELVKDVNQKLEDFRIEFNPENFRVNHDTTLGSDSDDELTVNATAEFNAPATFNNDATFNNTASFNQGLQSDNIQTDTLSVYDYSYFGYHAYFGHTGFTGSTGLSGSYFDVNSYATFYSDLTMAGDNSIITTPYLTVTKDVSIGTSIDDIFTVNAQTTFEGNTTVSEPYTLTTCNLIATNNSTIGQDGNDTLTINSTTNFANINAPVTVDGHFSARNDVELGTSTTIVQSLGTFSAPNIVLNQTSGNTVKIGNSINLVEYVTLSANTNISIAYPNNLILVVKNIATNLGGPIDISINLGSGGSVNLPASKTGTFLKISSSTYAMIADYSA